MTIEEQMAAHRIVLAAILSQHPNARTSLHNVLRNQHDSVAGEIKEIVRIADKLPVLPTKTS